MTKGLTELSLLHISNTFLNILAVHNKAVFCTTPTLNVVPSFSIHLSNSLLTLPRAPITTGTTSTFLRFHNLPISLFKSWYFSTLSLSFSSTLTSAGTALLLLSLLLLSLLLLLLFICCYTALTRPNQVETAVHGCMLAFSLGSIMSLSR